MYESGENYLETILILKERQGTVRSIDIARTLNFSKPSVSRAMGILREDGYIVMESSGVTEFLQKVSRVGPETAEEDACKMEHIISEETFQGIKRFMEKA